MNATVACRNPIPATDIFWKKVSMACFLGVLLLSPASNARAQSNEPALKISGTNGNITVSWPAAFYYSALASTVDEPAPAASWFWASTATPMFSFYTNLTSFDPSNLYNAPVTATVSANECQFTLPATNAQQYFKLMPMRVIPIFQFAIFYDGLLEFSTAATLNINGPVHANGPIYTGSGSPLTFYDTVTTGANISSPPNAGSSPPWAYTGVFLRNPANVTNTSPLRPDVETNNLHAIIEIPPSGEDPESQMGSQRYYNKAGIVILVSNTTASVFIKSSPTDTPITITVATFGTNSPGLQSDFPFLSVTNRFRERREAAKTNFLTQIDIGLYNQWLLTNSAVNVKFPPFSHNWPNIIYVADNRTPSSTVMYSVRLTNGVAIPTNGNTGFTLATRNPLYVWGDYNCPVSANLGTTNTAGSQPASFACDAFNVLSANFTDSESYLFYNASSSTFYAVNTTVNAALITGIVSSIGFTTSTFSGGIHNLPRLQENWTSRTLTLNSSIVCLFNSDLATNRFIWPGITYHPPARRWGFDKNFKDLTKLPPGTPFVGVVEK